MGGKCAGGFDPEPSPAKRERESAKREGEGPAFRRAVRLLAGFGGLREGSRRPVNRSFPGRYAAARLPRPGAVRRAFARARGSAAQAARAHPALTGAPAIHGRLDAIPRPAPSCRPGVASIAGNLGAVGRAYAPDVRTMRAPAPQPSPAKRERESAKREGEGPAFRHAACSRDFGSLRGASCRRRPFEGCPSRLQVPGAASEGIIRTSAVVVAAIAVGRFSLGPSA